MDFNKISSPFDCLLFDLDDTLYPSGLGIAQACKRNIEEFLVRKFGVGEERATFLRAEYFRSYGSTLAGLLALGHDVHPDEYHSFVHGRLPYENIRPDPKLRQLLLSTPQTKIMFTNSDRKHAKKVLEKLGIEEEIFECIICFETLNPHLFKTNNSSTEVILKPSLSAVEVAIRLAGSDPHHTLFLDDSERNIAAGKALGLRTVLVGKRVKTNEADYLVDGMFNLKAMIPEIWGQKKKNANANEEHDSIVMRIELDSIRPTTTIEA
ncbi:uncharacterized protein A4U43_C08F8930 [Asparagus officinalis]|uniref:suppressor of disruption of TFIIS n=1 Tax=Asparagus officinalis TaxID=4686 RepID=UPI00098E2C4F|nr:suppressor of disruption of TFIIS [Asparagus officinalis]ONK59656.1 uncharacterized protein A4U43_C08F8930 [Asparagus officinalis]